MHSCSPMRAIIFEVGVSFPRPISFCAGLFMMASLLLSATSWGGEADRPGVDSVVTAGQRFVLSSAVMGEEREVLVHLPQSYMKSQQHYPVLFILDGSEHFLSASGIVDVLARADHIPELILVAIPNMGNRNDMSPPGPLDKEILKGSIGTGDKFLSFLVDELLPWLDARYRTQPYRILSGHSRGGLFNLYALLERPGAFQAHIAVSPAWWWDDRAVVRRAKSTLGSHSAGKRWLYISWGGREPEIRDSIHELVDWMREQEFASLQWKSRHYPDEDHGSTPLRTLQDGLRWVFSGWYLNVPNSKALERTELQRRIHDHFFALSQRYGYSIEPSAGARYRLLGE